MKKLISAIVLFAVILSGTALATTSSKQINVEYGISVTVNGDVLVPKDVNGKVVDPFVYDGTTYVPVRAISDALGASVGYDAETNSAAITGKKDQINHAGEVKDCVEKIKIVNEYENMSYEFMMNFQNLFILVGYYETIPVSDLTLLKTETRKNINALKEKAADIIKEDNDISFIDATADRVLNLTDLAIDTCVTFASLQNQDTFNKLSGYITSGMEAAYELNTLVQDELDEIYTVIDGISTEGAATPAA
ncbi:MAG: stalk domain-containing protein [Eubacteriales bacterium]